MVTTPESFDEFVCDDLLQAAPGGGMVQRLTQVPRSRAAWFLLISCVRERKLLNLSVHLSLWIKLG